MKHRQIGTSMDVITARRRWKRLPLRLSLRTLMALIVVFGVALASFIIPARTQRDAVAVLKRVGGAVAYDVHWSRGPSALPQRKSPVAEWVRRRLGPDYVDTATYVRLMDKRFEDESLRAAGRLPALEELIVIQTGVTDAGVEEIGRLKNLRSLDLRLNDRVTGPSLRHLGSLSELRELRLAMKLSPVPLKDEDLAFIKRLTKLEHLQLPSTDLTDAWLDNIEGLTNLETLELYDMAITTKGLDKLKGLSNLEVLMLHGTRITSLEPLRPLNKIAILCIGYTPIDDSALVTLQDWPRLYHLDLRKTNVTDAGLIVLSGLAPLRELELSQTKVTDAGLMHLAKSKGLRSVDVRDTKVTDAGIAEFSKINPLVKVTK